MNTITGCVPYLARYPCKVFCSRLEAVFNHIWKIVLVFWPLIHFVFCRGSFRACCILWGVPVVEDGVAPYRCLFLISSRLMGLTEWFQKQMAKSLWRVLLYSWKEKEQIWSKCQWENIPYPMWHFVFCRGSFRACCILWGVPVVEDGVATYRCLFLISQSHWIWDVLSLTFVLLSRIHLSQHFG
jgi:hypothetical protein